MAVRNQSGMALNPSQLNDLDEAILDLLAEGRATPTLLREELAEREIREVSRQYISSRLSRLQEHGHVRNLRETGVYELVDDPRDSA